MKSPILYLCGLLRISLACQPSSIDGGNVFNDPVARVTLDLDWAPQFGTDTGIAILDGFLNSKIEKVPFVKRALILEVREALPSLDTTAAISSQSLLGLKELYKMRNQTRVQADVLFEVKGVTEDQIRAFAEQAYGKHLVGAYQIYHRDKVPLPETLSTQLPSSSSSVGTTSFLMDSTLLSSLLSSSSIPPPSSTQDSSINKRNALSSQETAFNEDGESPREESIIGETQVIAASQPSEGSPASSVAETSEAPQESQTLGASLGPTGNVIYTGETMEASSIASINIETTIEIETSSTGLPSVESKESSDVPTTTEGERMSRSVTLSQPPTQQSSATPGTSTEETEAPNLTLNQEAKGGNINSSLSSTKTTIESTTP